MEDPAAEAVAVDVLLAAVVAGRAVDARVVVSVAVVPRAALRQAAVPLAAVSAPDLPVEGPVAGSVHGAKAPAVDARAAAAGIVVRGLMAAETLAATASPQNN